MHYKFVSVVLSSILLAGLFSPTVGATPQPTAQKSVIGDAATKRSERVLWAYNKKYYPTRASIPSTYYYNDGEYAGTLKITYVTSYRDGSGEWWSVTYEGTVYPIS